MIEHSIHDLIDLLDHRYRTHGVEAYLKRLLLHTTEILPFCLDLGGMQQQSF